DQHRIARGAHQRDAEPQQHGEGEGDECYPQRGDKAARQGTEYLAVALVGDDGPQGDDAQQGDGEKPEGEVGEAPAGFDHEVPDAASLEIYWAALYSKNHLRFKASI